MRESNAPKTFFSTLDAIRGVAALLVMLRHVGFFEDLRFQESYLAVDVFFLLSGVVIGNAYEARLRAGMSVWAFSWVRAVRIFPLYLLGSALTACAWLAGDSVAPTELAWLAVLACLMLPSFQTAQPFPLNHPAWSLFFELVANLSYALVLRWLSTRVLAIVVAIGAIGIVALLWSAPTHSLDVGWSQANFSCGLIRVGFSFFAGVLLFRIYAAASARQQQPGAKPRAAAPAWRAWLYVALVAALLMSCPSAALQPWFDGAVVLVAFPWLVYQSLWCEPVGYAARVARWLGAVSYPVYVLHVPLSLWVHQDLALYNDLPGPTATLWIGAGFVACLLPLCSVLNRYYDARARRLLLTYGPR